MSWEFDSWQQKQIRQMPRYADKDALDHVLRRLQIHPPLVFAGEVRALKDKLARVAEGKAFLLQGGDCAESFCDLSADNIRDTFRILLQMAVVLTYATKKPVIKVGRIAGQFAKPRSESVETRDGVSLPSYRGDIINDLRFTEEARAPDPARMLRAYSQSAATINLLRAFAQGGFADLSRVASWNLEFVENSPEAQRYHDIAKKIDNALQFIAACGVETATTADLRQVDFYTSHEVLLLPYEQALTRQDSLMGDIIAGSAHMLWIGDRTRQLDSAHVEYCRGISNPLGVKCGPNIDSQELLRLIEVLDPDNEPGRLTLIGRFGADKVEKHLPALARAVANEGRSVIWMCDPMHGNTVRASSGVKTRRFDQITEEMHKFFQIMHSEGLYPGGIHVEVTGKNVTECTGGMQKLDDADLGQRYHSLVDPRLNASQGLELAFLSAEEMEKRSESAVADSSPN